MKQLEPRNKSPEMQDGLQARIHDPLWFLTRQWQTGEFKADDAGSPVGAQLAWETCPIARYRPGPIQTNQASTTSGTAAAMDYLATNLPLETLVERENPAQGINLRLAAQAGLHFSRLLKLSGLAKYANAFLSAFPVSSPSETERKALDAATLNYLAVIAKRVIDGAGLYAKLSRARSDNETITLPAEPPFGAVEPADRPAMISMVTKWLNWHDNLFSKSKPDEASWVKSRMERGKKVSAMTYCLSE